MDDGVGKWSADKLVGAASATTDTAVPAAPD